MNWKQRLFKPKWQNKSADIRLESVTKEQDPELIGSLVEIARTDEDKRVRCAAIKRLHQLENILKLYGNETDNEVKILLEERIRQLTSSSADTRPALNLRMQVIELTSDRDLIEHLASHAPEAELRRAAIAKVARQGVLGDCCINDSDSENRHFAASRITQHTTLRRVIEELRKRDKSLHTQLQERLHEELLNQSDPKAIQLEALNICTALEKLALEADTFSGETAEVKALHTAWQGIANKTTSDMAERYQRVCGRLVAPAVPTSRPSTQPVTAIKPEPKPVDPPSTALTEPLQPNESLTELTTTICLYEEENTEQPRSASVKKLKAQLDSIWKQCSPPHQHDLDSWNEANTVLQRVQATLELRQQAFEKELSEAQDQLTQMESELQDGELHKALETRAKIQIAGKGHGKNKDWQRINRQMSGMQARLRELRDWHHWSNNKIRKRLIAEMEVLPAAELHPDALLDRIKSLQKEWKALEESEQIPGDKRFSAAPWMWRKFSAAGHTAFDTAKPYLDKRSEIQSRHAQSLDTFCAELAQLAKADPMDWTALGKGLNRGRKKLHDLNNVPANQRKKIARKLKTALDRANAVMQEHYQDVEKEKMKLIRAASQLIHMPERSEAITQAKSLQSNWKAAGSLWRSKEQELWNQFREYLDPLFTELKDQQASERAADDERLAAQKALCSELREILKTEQDLSALHGKVQGLQDGWKDIQHPDRRLVQTFQDMVAEYQKKVEGAEQQEVETNRERWWLKSMLLHELTVSGRTTKGALSKKTESRVTKAWPEKSSSDELETRMDKACKDLLAGEKSELTENITQEMQDKARALCISLEFLAGLPSPPEDRDQRMTYQVDRLAETMSGESSRQPAADEASDAEKNWLEMYTLPEADFGAFGKRIRKALKSVKESHT